MPKLTDIEKILVIGSGPIIIGQAAEFDYSGTQACKALKEEGYEVVLINSNPATIMTDLNMADKVYIEPITLDTVIRILKKEKPQGIIATLGGQTGLNMAIELDQSGILPKLGIRLLGTQLTSIKLAEDRELFKDLMVKNGQKTTHSTIVTSLEEAEAFSHECPFPLIVRPAYTLGGTGGGVAHNMDELMDITARGLKMSLIHQVLLEQSVAGWKEIEYEVIRDNADNCIIVCNMENIDPVGIHTGDSIVVAPSQTLTDREYQMLRTSALKIIRALDIRGGCNIQYALDPANETMPDGSPAFAAGVSRLDAGINAAADGTVQLADGSADLYAGLSELNGKLPALSDGIDQLAGGAEQLDTGANALSEKTPALADGVSQLAAGGSKLAAGVGQAADGVTQLADGSSSLHEGLASLSDQVPALADGVGQLTDGTSELKTKLADGVDYIDGNLVNSSETMAAYISDPVTMSNQPLNPVPDYGTGFAPYFIPLSLWVGAILMFFIISPREDPSLKANSAQSAIGKYLSYAFIGLLQAVMVGAVVFTLGLQPNNIPLYFLTIIVMSLTAIAIVQMLISLLGDAGRLIAIVLLILQLTADAGTFPLELVPNFFKVLNPFMPFTYCVTALRESISGTNITLIWQCIGMLLIFLGVFLTLTVIFKKRAEKMQEHVNQLRFTE